MFCIQCNHVENVWKIMYIFKYSASEWEESLTTTACNMLCTKQALTISATVSDLYVLMWYFNTFYYKE